MLLPPKLKIHSLLATWVNLEVWSLFSAVGFRCFSTGCSLFVILLGFENHLYVNDPDPLFFSSLPINLLFEAHGCVSKIGKWCFLVKNWVVLAWWSWLLELITKLTLWIIRPLNSVQWYPIRLTPLGNFEAALLCRLTACPVQMADVFIFKSSKKAVWNKRKVGRTSPQRDFDTGARGFMKDKTAHFFMAKGKCH